MGEALEKEEKRGTQEMMGHLSSVAGEKRDKCLERKRTTSKEEEDRGCKQKAKREKDWKS